MMQCLSGRDIQMNRMKIKPGKAGFLETYMNHIHSREKEQFKKLFEQEKVDRIEERFKILDLFLQIENHVTLAHIKDTLTGKGVDSDDDFLRDTMKLLCRFGFAQKIQFEDGLIRYEHRHLGQHHDHMICTKCGKITEFQDQRLENYQLELASANGFHMLQHKMEIYGICGECLKQHIRKMPLSIAKPGERLVISDFSGGANSRMRLLTMGLRIGDRIEVVTNPSAGQLVIAVDFKRYVIGRGMSQKILVEPLKDH
jgi:Fur family transcriptional regulator, ferric uptake regulator